MSGIRDALQDQQELLKPRCLHGAELPKRNGWDINTCWAYHMPTSHPQKAYCNTSSLEYSAGDQGHILLVKFPSWRPARCPLGIWVCSSAIQYARRSNTCISARRETAKNLVKIRAFRVMSGWEKSLLLMPFAEVVDETALQWRQNQCFNWSFIPVDTTLRFFVCFSWKKPASCYTEDL